MDIEQLKEEAFQRWAFTCNRRMDRVREELLEDLGEDIEIEVLNAWALEGEWSISVRNKIEELAPDLTRRTWAAMAMAEEAAADYMLSVVRGDFFPGRNWEEDIDPSLIKIRMEAAKNVMHMTGWSPTGLNVKERPKDPYNLTTSKPLAELTDAELAALESGVVDAVQERKVSQSERVKKNRRGG